ncbi:hypothetical protein N7471_000191 [Penicillium samsonianum]|uniref:uncharacterized protein n=1 Tax=Penicillium samsonianum TaxID=1882272 RepID=UPI0025491E63|nr:uncharacterized protein N7471_000191 [Penicillium samsonianum]KAJ6148992.1 hypothetical protein N7471_000191 [Penicillium samsonianum]
MEATIGRGSCLSPNRWKLTGVANTDDDGKATEEIEGGSVKRVGDFIDHHTDFLYDHNGLARPEPSHSRLHRSYA